MPKGVFVRTEKHREALRGYVKTAEHRKHLSESMKGHKFSEEHNKKISESNKGRSVWNKGLKGNQVPWNKGLKGYRAGTKHPWMPKGKNHFNWQGGKSFEPYTVDWTQTLKRSIRERDGYVCQICGASQEDKVFSVHHIDYNKKNCNPENLITLCRGCHTKTNYNRNKWIIYFKELQR
jgi:hypothetical protein